MSTTAESISFLDEHLTAAMQFDSMLSQTGYPTVNDFNRKLIETKLKDFFDVPGAKKFMLKSIEIFSTDYDRVNDLIRFRITLENTDTNTEFFCDFIVNLARSSEREVA